MTDTIETAKLHQYISKIERLEQEKSDISDDIKDVFAEAKAMGFDTKIMKKVLKLMKMDKNKLAEEDELIELYRRAVGL